MKLVQPERSEAVSVEPDGAPAEGGAGREILVVLPGGSRRQRLAGALRRAGYRLADRWQPAAWQRARRSPVLLTDDTDGGSRARAEVVAAAPGTSCVVLVDEPTPARYRQLLASGVTALPASSPDGDVVFAVGAASRELACLPASAARTLGGSEDGGPFEPDRPVLSGREQSWLRALARGVTVAGLARSAGYSQREMYRLLAGVYSRLGADTRTEALLRADRWGLLTPDGAVG